MPAVSKLHVPAACKIFNRSPGHNRALHSRVSNEGPREEQSTPPLVSLGKVHFRVLSCVPPPQVAEHKDQWDQSEYTPVTGAMDRKINTVQD